MLIKTKNHHLSKLKSNPHLLKLNSHLNKKTPDHFPPTNKPVLHFTFGFAHYVSK